MFNQPHANLSQAEIMRDRMFQDGNAQCRKLVQAISATTIHDVLVPPAAMQFVGDESGVRFKIRGDHATKIPGSDLDKAEIHSHALSQLCSKCEMNGLFARRLISKNTQWANELVAHNLNELFQNAKFAEGVKFLHRFVRGELRGFLSRRYNRNLSSGPLLAAFMSACHLNNAYPANAVYGAVRNRLTCAQREIHLSNSKSPVLVGVEWSNSDFGAGRHSISLVVLTPYGSRWVVERGNALSQVHIGGVLEDSDLEISEDTQVLELEAQTSGIRDAVTQQLSPKVVGIVIRAIERMQEESLTWAQAAGILLNYLTRAQVEEARVMMTEQVEFLPAVQAGAASPMWVMEVLSHFARKSTEDKQSELESAAGSILGKYTVSDEAAQ